MISQMSGTPYRLVENPRNEAAENELRVANDRFLGLGLEPTRLQDGLLTEVQDITRKYIDRCGRTKIRCTSLWRAPSLLGAAAPPKAATKLAGTTRSFRGDLELPSAA